VCAVSAVSGVDRQTDDCTARLTCLLDCLIRSFLESFLRPALPYPCVCNDLPMVPAMGGVFFPPSICDSFLCNTSHTMAPRPLRNQTWWAPPCGVGGMWEDRSHNEEARAPFPYSRVWHSADRQLGPVMLCGVVLCCVGWLHYLSRSCCWSWSVLLIRLAPHVAHSLFFPLLFSPCLPACPVCECVVCGTDASTLMDGWMDGCPGLAWVIYNITDRDEDTVVSECSEE